MAVPGTRMEHLRLASLCGLASTEHGGGPQRERLGRTGQELFSSLTQDSHSVTSAWSLACTHSSAGSRDPTSDGSRGDILVRRPQGARPVVQTGSVWSAGCWWCSGPHAARSLQQHP